MTSKFINLEKIFETEPQPERDFLPPERDFVKSLDDDEVCSLSFSIPLISISNLQEGKILNVTRNITFTPERVDNPQRELWTYVYTRHTFNYSSPYVCCGHLYVDRLESKVIEGTVIDPSPLVSQPKPSLNEILGYFFDL